MIRPIEERDKAALKKLECGLEWTYEGDFMDGLVFTDDNDVPVMCVGAWSRAEVHMLADSSWGTPGMRLAVLKSLHDGMEERLKRRGVGVVVTWLDGMKAFTRRLKSLGWLKSERTSWLRRVG